MEKKSAYTEGYSAALVKIGLATQTSHHSERRVTDQSSPVSDAKLPVGRLVSAMSDVDFPVNQETAVRPSTPISPSEERLNKPVTWSSTSSIPQSYMNGPTPILPGRF